MNIDEYDNAPDLRAMELKSFPHHKHLKKDKLVESAQITLYDVLKEIERMFIK